MTNVWLVSEDQMTLGILLPLITIVMAVFETWLLRRHIASLESGLVNPPEGQDKDQTIRTVNLIIAASWFLPVAAYAALNIFTDAGTVEIF